EAAAFQAVDRLVGLVRGRASYWDKRALAALRISFARLNSATSLRSCFSSSRSTLVSRSSRSPLSASAWRTQPRRASLWMPRSFATCAIGRPVVRTSRTARSRSSSGYLRGAGTARGSPSGQDHKPGFRDSTKPGAAQSDVCRRYWRRFGDLRAQEAEGDERAEHFTRVLNQAANNRPRAQPAADCRHATP